MSELIDSNRPDGVDTYPADATMPAIYRKAREQLQQFRVPVLGTAPHKHMFVANFDGTGNDMHQDPLHITNVGSFSKQIKQAYADGLLSVADSYAPGVGTQDNQVERLVDGAVGYSYGPRMEQMYLDFITQSKEWRQQDPNAEISLAAVGFSRGAVTASLFTRLVHERGIQNPDGMMLERDRDGQIIGMTPTKPPLVTPGQTRQVLGLFDPVATGELNLVDVRPAPSVVSGLQITALHDRRDQFPAKQILDPGLSADGRFLNVQVAGAHSDIGGSYLLNGLSIRSGNLMAGYLNTVAGQALLQDQPVPSDPRMNVVHRSEQHQAVYSTAVYQAAGRRAITPNLDGRLHLPRSDDANNPLPMDPRLAEGLHYRQVQLPAERLDDRVPAFLLPEPGPAAPHDVQWNQLLQNTPFGLQRGDPTQTTDGAIRPAGVGRTPHLDPRVAAIFEASERGDMQTIAAIGREYAQTDAGRAWLQQGRDELERQLQAERLREQLALERQAREQELEQAREQEQERQHGLVLQVEEPQRRMGRSI